MSETQFFAITEAGLRSLPVPPGAQGFADLYTNLPQGVYSALRTFDHNKFLDLEAHLARTRRSMAVLGWTYTWDEMRLRRAIHTACTAFPGENARVRFDILAEPAPEKLGTDSRELLALRPFIPIHPNFYHDGIGVQLAPKLIRANPLAKTADFAQERERYHPGSDQTAYERLLVNAKGQILEGTMTNFWAVKNGEVYTAGGGVLEGVTRKILLELIKNIGLPLRLEAVHVDELPYLDEAAISGSSRALLPVVKIEGVTIGNGRPGPVFQQLLNAYNIYLDGAIDYAVSE